MSESFKDYVVYTAACPACGEDTPWHAWSTGNGNDKRVHHRVDCACVAGAVA